jgi:predicted TIM-barrel fold metal-dependent hydrolase
MTWIDSHIHIWTSDTQKYPLAGGQTAADLDPPDFTPETYLRHARPSGISKVVIVQTGYHQFDNSYATDTVKRFPDVFRVIGIVDETKENVQDDMEALKEQGVGGFRIGVDYDGPQWDRMWEAAARTGQAMCPITMPPGGLAIHKMAAKHPDTNVVVDHMTRIGEREPINDEHIEQLTDIAKLPNTYVKISRLHALGDGPPHDDLIPMIKRVIDAFGPERCMWGSDSPYQVVKETMEDSISVIRDKIGLSESDRHQILRGTAERLFFS